MSLIRPRIQTWDQPRQIVGGPQADGLIGAWPLADGGGTTAVDLKGKNSGVIASLAGWTGGPCGPAPLFDGTASTITVANTPELNPSYITLSAWIKVTGSTSLPQIISRDAYGTQGGRVYQFRLNGSVIEFIPFSAGSNSDISGTTSVSDGAWHHVAATWNGAVVNLYVDGKVDATPVSFSGSLRSGQTNDTTIGYGQVNYWIANVFRGGISDVRIYNRALAAAEIQALYADPLALVRPALRRTWSIPSGGYTAALTGISTTGSLGTLGVIRTSPLAQIGSTASLGIVVPGIAHALAPITATGTTGTLTTSRAVALQGLVATGTAGTLKAAHAHALTGVAASGSVGTLAPVLSVAVAGVAAVGSVGYMVPSFSVPLTGASVAASLGTLSAQLTLSLSGVVASGTLGVMQPAGGHDVTVALTGVSTVGSVGTMSAQTAVALSGLSASGAIGSLGVDLGVPLSGLAATTYLGNLTVHGAILYVAPFRVLTWPMERRILAWPTESRVLTWPTERRILRMQS